MPRVPKAAPHSSGGYAVPPGTGLHSQSAPQQTPRCLGGPSEGSLLCKSEVCSLEMAGPGSRHSQVQIIDGQGEAEAEAGW